MRHHTTTLVLDSTHGYRCSCGHEELRPFPPEGLTPELVALGARRHVEDQELTAMERSARLLYGRAE